MKSTCMICGANRAQPYSLAIILQGGINEGLHQADVDGQWLCRGCMELVADELLDLIQRVKDEREKACKF